MRKTVRSTEPIPKTVVMANLVEIASFPVDAVNDLALDQFYASFRSIPGFYYGANRIGDIGQTFAHLMAQVTQPVSVPAGEIRIYDTEWTTARAIVNAVGSERHFRNFAEAAAIMSAVLRKPLTELRNTLLIHGYPNHFVFPEGVITCKRVFRYSCWDVGARLSTNPER